MLEAQGKGEGGRTEKMFRHSLGPCRRQSMGDGYDWRFKLGQTGMKAMNGLVLSDGVGIVERAIFREIFDAVFPSLSLKKLLQGTLRRGIRV